MTVQEVSKLRVGSKIRTILGDTQTVVAITDGIMYEMKWVQSDGNLSRGSEFKVPSHFNHDELISL